MRTSLALPYVLLLHFVQAPMAAQERIWARQFGSSGSDSARALAPDGVGGMFITGDTAGSLGGPSAGAQDVWLARYDLAGERMWILQFGTSAADVPNALVAASAGGGVFVAGYTSGGLGGPSAGGFDGWIARYDAAGHQLWIRQLGTGGDDYAWALASDRAGGVFVAGWTGGSLGGPSAGANDAWLARYSASGTQLWIRQFGSSSVDSARALTPDGAGGVFIAGLTFGELGGPHAGVADVYIARFDAVGNRLWIRQLGTSATDWVEALAPDGTGGVFVAGNSWGSLGGPNAGQYDAWLARYDSAGNQIWIRQFGTADTEWPTALAPDSRGGVYLAGIAEGSLGGPSAGGTDAWLARYDAAGNQTWIRQFGSSSNDNVAALATAPAGDVFIAGRTQGEIGGPSAGGHDVWVARYGPSCYANCDGSTGLPLLNMNDFTCFIHSFTSAKRLPREDQVTHYTNCDGSTSHPVLTGQDIVCFMELFAQGCIVRENGNAPTKRSR